MAPNGENGYIDPKRDIGVVTITGTTGDGGVRVVRGEGIEDRIKRKMVQGEVCRMSCKA